MKGMNGNQVIAGYEKQIRYLRETIIQMEKDKDSGNFIEDLTCAAIPGLINKCHQWDDTSREWVAEEALQLADIVLQKIVANMIRADEERAKAQAEVAKANNEAAGQESNLILP